MNPLANRALIVLIGQWSLITLMAQPILIQPQSRPIMGSDLSNVRVTRQSPDGTEVILTMDFDYDGMSGPNARVVPVISDKKQPQVSRWFGCDPQVIGIGHGTISVKVKFFNDEPGVPREVTTDRIRILLLNSSGISVIQQNLVLKTIKWGNPNVAPTLLPAPKVAQKPAPGPSPADLAEQKRIADEHARQVAALQAQADANAKEAKRLQEELENQRIAEEKRQAQAKADAEIKAREEARLAAEAETKRVTEEKRLAEESARLEREAKAREEARLKAEADAKRIAEERRVADEKARQEAEARVREQARLKAEAEAKTREEARLKEEAEAKRLAEERRATEEKTRLEAANREKARLAEEEQKRRAAEEKMQADEKVLRRASELAQQGSITELDQIIHDSPALEPRLAVIKQKAQGVRADVLSRAGAFVDTASVEGLRVLQQQFRVPELDALAAQALAKSNSIAGESSNLAAKGDEDTIASLQKRYPILKEALEPDHRRAGEVATNVLQQANGLANKASVAELNRLAQDYPALAVRLDPIKLQAQALRADVLKRGAQFAQDANAQGVAGLQEQYSLDELKASAVQARQNAEAIAARAKAFADKADTAEIVDLQDRYPVLKSALETQRQAAQALADQIVGRGKTLAGQGSLDDVDKLVQQYPALRARLDPFARQAETQASDALVRAAAFANQGDVAGIRDLQKKFNIPDLEKLASQAQQTVDTALADAKSSAEKADLIHLKDLRQKYPSLAQLEALAAQAREKANTIANQSKAFADKGDENAVQDLEKNYPALKERLDPDLARSGAFAGQTVERAAALASQGGVGEIEKVMQEYPALRARLETVKQKAESARADAISQATALVAKADVPSIKRLQSQFPYVSELEKSVAAAGASADETAQKAEGLSRQGRVAEVKELIRDFPALQSRLEPLARQSEAARMEVLARATNFVAQADASSISNLANQYPQLTELNPLAAQAGQEADRKISDAGDLAAQARVAELDKLAQDFPALQPRLQPLQQRARTQLVQVLTQATNFLDKADAASINTLVSQYPHISELQSLLAQAGQKADEIAGQAGDFASQGRAVEIDKLLQDYPSLQSRLTPLRERAQARIKAREEARLRAEAEAKRASEEQAKAEADARAKEEVRIKEEAEAKRVAEETKLAEEKARAEVAAKALEEARQRAAVEAKRLADERRAAEEKAKQDAIAREAKLKADAEARAIELARLQAEAEAKAREAARLKSEAEQKRTDEAKRLAEERVKAAEASPPGASGGSSPVFAINPKLHTRINNVDVVNRSLDRTEMTIGVEFAYSSQDGAGKLGVDLASTDDPQSTSYFTSQPLDVKGSRNLLLIPVKFRPPRGAVGESYPTDKIWIYLSNGAEKSYIFSATMLLVWRPPGGAGPAAAAPVPKSTVSMESFRQNDPFSGYASVNYNLAAAGGKIRLRVYDSHKPDSADWFQSEDVPVKSGLGVQLVRIAVPGNSSGPDLFNADTIEILLLGADDKALAAIKSPMTLTWAKPK